MDDYILFFFFSFLLLLAISRISIKFFELKIKNIPVPLIDEMK